MLACLLKEESHVVMQELPAPSLKDGDVLVRFRAGGICGTDIEKIRGGYGPGGILGHEVSGAVEQVGKGVKDLTPGERVVPHHHVPCYKCELCTAGDFTMCDYFKETNFDPCGFAETFRVPAFNVSRGALVKLPSSVSFEEAALLEPTACCMRALKAAKVRPGQSVLIVGLGPAGLTHLQLLKRIGAGPLFGTDIQEARLDHARRLGVRKAIDPAKEDVAKAIGEDAKTGVDLAIVSTGNPKAISQAASALRKGGTILLFGAPPRGSILPFDVGTFFARQLSILTSYSCTESEIRAATSFVAEGKLDLNGLISHRFSLREAPRALDFASRSHEAIKTMILP